MSKGNPFLALRLSLEQQQVLRMKAAASRMTVSDLVRQILADHGDGLRSHSEVSSPQSHKLAVAHTRCPRKPSRPARLQGAICNLEDLLAEYEGWQANLPDSLQDTATAAALAETIDNLQQAVDALNATTPPRGFGRD